MPAKHIFDIAWKAWDGHIARIVRKRLVRQFTKRGGLSIRLGDEIARGLSEGHSVYITHITPDLSCLSEPIP